MGAHAAAIIAPIFAKTRSQIDEPLGCCAMSETIATARQA
jgi:hypothetical protein